MKVLFYYAQAECPTNLIYELLFQIIRKALTKEKQVSTKTSAADLVTETDHFVENLIISVLKEKFPSHRWVPIETINDLFLSFMCCISHWYLKGTLKACVSFLYLCFFLIYYPIAVGHFHRIPIFFKSTISLYLAYFVFSVFLDTCI